MYQQLGKKRINASVIWGNVDEIVPFDGLSYLKTDYPNINFEVIEPNKRKITLKSYADNFTK